MQGGIEVIEIGMRQSADNRDLIGEGCLPCEEFAKLHARYAGPSRPEGTAHLFGGIWYTAAAQLPRPGFAGSDWWAWLAEHPDERKAVISNPAESAPRKR